MVYQVNLVSIHTIINTIHLICDYELNWFAVCINIATMQPSLTKKTTMQPKKILSSQLKMKRNMDGHTI